MKNSAPPLIENSVRFYRMLLWMYPKEHREEYGWLMVQLFHDKARDAYSQDGDAGIVLHWMAVLLDLAISVIQERREKGFTMSFNSLGKVGKPLMLLGGLLLTLSSFSSLKSIPWYRPAPLYDFLELLQIPGLFIFALGFFGGYVMNRRVMPAVAKIALLVSAVLCLMMVVLGTVEATFSINYFEEYAWELYLTFLMGILLSLAIFGFSMMHNGYRLGLIATIPSLLVVIILSIIWLMGGPNPRDTGPYWDGLILFATIGLVFMLIGHHFGRELVPKKMSRDNKFRPQKIDSQLQEGVL